MLGDIAFWGAVIFVIAMLADPAWGNLLVWRKTRFHMPAFVHALAFLLLLSGLALSGVPSGFLAALAAYAVYGMFGGHLDRSMADCERQSGRGIANEEAKTVLSAELQTFKRMSRADLAAMLWKSVEKEVPAPGNSIYRLKIEVLPAIYKWEGGNADRFANLMRSVEAGGNIKVIGMLTPVEHDVLCRRGRICLSFEIDSNGEIHADTSDLANVAAV